MAAIGRHDRVFVSFSFTLIIVRRVTIISSPAVPRQQMTKRPA
jgi:hypothetical protein